MAVVPEDTERMHLNVVIQDALGTLLFGGAYPIRYRGPIKFPPPHQ